MAHKLVLLLVCMASMAFAGQYLEQMKEKEQSVAALNAYLMDELQSFDPEQNMKAAKDALYAHPQFKYAIDALETLEKGGRCDTRIIDILRSFVATVKIRKVEQVFGHYLRKPSTKACMDALEHKSTPRFDDPMVNNLLKEFAHPRIMKRVFNYGEDEMHFYHRFLSAPTLEDYDERNLDNIAKLMSIEIQALAASDPKAELFIKGFDEETKKETYEPLPENFRYAFETYLLKPCQQITEKTEALYEGFYGLSKFLINPTQLPEFKDQVKTKTSWGRSHEGGYKIISKLDYQYLSKYFSKSFQNGLLAYRRCRLIESYDEKTVEEVLRWAYLRSDYY